MFVRPEQTKNLLIRCPQPAGQYIKLSLRGTSMLISDRSYEHARKGNLNLLDTTCRVSIILRGAYWSTAKNGVHSSMKQLSHTRSKVELISQGSKSVNEASIVASIPDYNFTKNMNGPNTSTKARESLGMSLRRRLIAGGAADLIQMWGLPRSP